MKKIYIGTNTKNQKIKNIEKNNQNVSFCVDVGVNAPDIYGVMGQGIANIILEIPKVRNNCKKILLNILRH